LIDIVPKLIDKLSKGSRFYSELRPGHWQTPLFCNVAELPIDRYSGRAAWYSLRSRGYDETRFIQAIHQQHPNADVIFCCAPCTAIPTCVSYLSIEMAALSIEMLA